MQSTGSDMTIVAPILSHNKLYFFHGCIKSSLFAASNYIENDLFAICQNVRRTLQLACEGSLPIPSILVETNKMAILFC